MVSATDGFTDLPLDYLTPSSTTSPLPDPFTYHSPTNSFFMYIIRSKVVQINFSKVVTRTRRSVRTQHRRGSDHGMSTISLARQAGYCRAFRAVACSPVHGAVKAGHVLRKGISRTVSRVWTSPSSGCKECVRVSALFSLVLAPHDCHRSRVELSPASALRLPARAHILTRVLVGMWRGTTLCAVLQGNAPHGHQCNCESRPARCGCFQ